MLQPALSVAVVMVSCAAAASAVTLTASPPPCPTPGPPPFESYDNEKAAKFFALIERDPAMPEVRYNLTRLYKEMHGYTRVSEFYAFTGEYLEGKPLHVAKTAPLAPSTACNIFTGETSSEAKAQEERMRAVAHDVATEWRRDELFSGEGLAAAASALREHGAYCHLLSEWCTALLWFAATHPDKTAASAREVAVRLLITLAEENISAEGYEGPASAYFLLAEYFSLRRDYVSAYVAALIAKDRLGAGSVTGSENAGSFRQRLDDEIDKLTKLAEEQRKN